MTPDLHDRAAAVLGQSDCDARWPYGLEYPPLSLRRKGREAYERRMSETKARQEVMVAWAERYGLRLSPAGCCPLWLGRDGSKRCPFSAERGSRCTRYGSPHPDSGWMDHAVAWLKDSRPAVITAAPYDVDPKDEQRLAYWERADSRLRAARGAGWYGFGTTQIVLWRSDRVTEIRPAEPLVSTP
ncbi:hypothetical protein [Streptomyces marianii]|uniref:Uncharacterized protein n=1 Tax=Streptomyces marianii TaxID=1817406 RepID=A0A5R9DTH9_9ACTN|nr:hypothetical protein [Streptomyces marianii]TLQ38990.1 hypothetical protein FEF34_39950 [Streptomyces marianii]